MVKVHQIETPQTVFADNFDIWFRSLVPEKESAQEALWESVATLLKSVVFEAEETALQLYKHGFEIANILSSLRANSTTLLAGLLYPFVDAHLLDVEDVAQKCSQPIANQLNGVASMDAIRSLQADYSNKNDAVQIDKLRRMLLAMVDDVRVVLIKLAERLSLLRNAATRGEDYQLHLAQEITDVYAPLANRLGIGQVKWEMEDLAFRILHREEYTRIAKSLDEKRTARETYVKNVLKIIGEALADIGIEADLQGRAKHIFSIWKKMQRKQVGFEEIYDMRAVRVLVPKIGDCYSVLGVVHGLWNHIPKEFDDYIATPKENGYRSLHTAVVGPEGKTLEIQIRTFDMHQESELGVAAHWKYKEGKSTFTDGYEAKIAWLRSLLEWQDEVTESADILEEFKHQVLEERVYVFTPQGKLIDLPMGATALDFAYRVHTDIGHRCRGAKVNGRIIPLTQALSTGQKVEILTTKNGGPSRDWLSEHQGYIHSSRARSKIQQWFRLQDKDKNIAAGKLLLEKELQKQNIKSVNFQKLAEHFHYPGEDELFSAVGSGEKGLHQVINVIRAQLDVVPVARKSIVKKSSKVPKRSASSDILVEGVGNLLTRMAGCCKPVPGEEICGYVTQGRGIMIHRADCRYLLSAQSHSPEKVLRVEWNDAVNESYLIDLIIRAYDRKGLLGDVTTTMADEKVSVTSLNTQVNSKRLTVAINIQIEVPNLPVVSRIMSRIEQLPTVVSVQRK